MLRGIGLIVLLVTVVVMGVLGAKVLTSTDTELPSTLPGSAGSEPEVTAAPAPRAAEAAGAALCDTNRMVLDTAVSAYEQLNGVQPDGQEALVAAGVLAEAVPDFQVTIIDGTLVVQGTGVCEGA